MDVEFSSFNDVLVGDIVTHYVDRNGRLQMVVWARGPYGKTLVLVEGSEDSSLPHAWRHGRNATMFWATFEGGQKVARKVLSFLASR